MSETSLPSFKKPPVVETVVGVQFAPVRGLTNGHLGAFWKKIAESSCAGERWTEVIDAPPLPRTFERFGERHEWAGIESVLNVSREPPPGRLQIRNDRGDALIQIQNGRLHYNWVGRGGQAYPRYGEIRPSFAAVLDALERFLRDEDLDPIKPDQWEVTYVNHIPRGTVWENPTDWSALFLGLPHLPADPGMVRLENMNGSWHFEIPERRGRLHVDVNSGRSGDDHSLELLRMVLTARGPVAAPEDEDGSTLAEGLDLGRRVIVLTFRDITSKDAHSFWELES